MAKPISFVTTDLLQKFVGLIQRSAFGTRYPQLLPGSGERIIHGLPATALVWALQAGLPAIALVCVWQAGLRRIFIRKSGLTPFDILLDINILYAVIFFIQ